MDGIRRYYVKPNKSIRERQLSYDLSDTRNLKGRAGGFWWVGKDKMKQDGTGEGDKS